MFSDVPVSVLILHVIGAIGFVIVVSMGLVTKPIRDLWIRIFKNYPTWSKMISCPMCFGVWGGASWAMVLVCRSHEPLWFRCAHDVVAFAFAVSLVGFLVALLDHAVGSVSDLKNPTNPKPSMFRRRRW